MHNKIFAGFTAPPLTVFRGSDWPSNDAIGRPFIAPLTPVVASSIVLDVGKLSDPWVNCSIVSSDLQYIDDAGC